MVGLAQFIVLFAGPIGLIGLTAFLVVRWVMQSWRREPTTPRLAVIPGRATDESGVTTAASEASPGQRRPLRVVAREPSGAPGDPPRSV